MQLKPEALNALKLPVKVKAGFLGSVKLKVGFFTMISISTIYLSRWDDWFTQHDCLITVKQLASFLDFYNWTTRGRKCV